MNTDDLVSDFLRTNGNAKASRWVGPEGGGPSLFGMECRVSWPFSLIVSQDCLAKYQRVFCHLFQFKFLEKKLVQAWQEQQLARRQRLGGSEEDLREALLCNETLHFVNSYLSQIGLKLQNLSKSFCRDLREKENIVELASLHEEYCDLCLDACFLRQPAARNLIQTAILSIVQRDTAGAQTRFQNAVVSLKKVIEWL